VGADAGREGKGRGNPLAALIALKERELF